MGAGPPLEVAGSTYDEAMWGAGTAAYSGIRIGLQLEYLGHKIATRLPNTKQFVVSSTLAS